MNRSKGFTLIELIIVIAIIAILVAVIWGAIGPRKAGAHELAPTGIVGVLAEKGVSYRWQSDTHTLLIIDAGTSGWTNSDAVCQALKDKVEHLHVRMRGAEGSAELRWEEPARAGESRVLTNLPSVSTTEC